MIRAPLSRRHLLRGAALSLALPLLDAMAAPVVPTGRHAGLYARAGRPKRLLTYYFPNGTLADRWFPAVKEDGAFAGALPEILAPLERHKGDLVVFQGLDNKAAMTGVRCTHRDIPTLMSGWGLVGSHPDNAGPGGITIDQILAARMDEAAPLKCSSVQIGFGAGFSSLGPARPLPNTREPARLFPRLFGDPKLGPEAQARLWQQRRSLLDDLGSEYKALAARLGGNDRARLEAHVDSLRILERRVAVGATCPTLPQMAPEADVATDALPDAARSFIEMTALAMACDVSRVASFTFRQGGGGASYFPWLGISGDYNSAEHHELSHFTMQLEKAAKFASINRWFIETLAALVERLKATPDGDGSLFDSSVILVASECANGAAHSKTNMPFLLLGNLAGRFRTGRLLRYEAHPHNALLLSVLHGFGVEAQAAGHPRLCPGPLPGLA